MFGRNRGYLSRYDQEQATLRHLALIMLGWLPLIFVSTVAVLFPPLLIVSVLGAVMLVGWHKRISNDWSFPVKPTPPPFRDRRR